MIKRTIVNIRDYQTGEEFNSNHLFTTLNEKEIFDLRDKLSKIARREEKKYLVCSLCNQSIIHSGLPNKKTNDITHFFKHYKDNDDCPIVTKGKHNQVELDTIRYNGAKESLRHIELKEFIHFQLKKDSRFKNEAMEQVVKSIKDKKLWRKPDVSSDFLDKKIVFEIQLQTTYLNVIRDREYFYKDNEIYIMWFFDSSNMEKFRFSEKDIFYANKSNAFVITDDSIRISQEKGQFLFYCFYKVPFVTDGTMDYKWKEKLITIDDLNFDNQNYKVYYYDFDAKENQIKNDFLEIENNKKFPWLSAFWDSSLKYDLRVINQEFTEVFRSNNINNFKMNDDLAKVLNTIYSLKKSQILGFDFNSFIALSNNFLEYYKEFSYIFLWAIEIYNLKSAMLEQDKKGTFQKKIDRFKKERYQQNNEYNQLFAMLFPALRSKLKL